MLFIGVKRILNINITRFYRLNNFSSIKNINQYSTTKKYLKDDEILVEKVRVLKDKKFMGDYSIHEAKLLAKKFNSNLILFKPNSIPPICVIQNYSDFIKSLENSTSTGVVNESKEDDKAVYAFDPSLKSKTVQISENCAIPDLNRKLSSIRKFITSGHKVDIILQTTNKTRKLTKNKQNTNNIENDIIEEKDSKLYKEEEGVLIQRIDYIYSRLNDIAKPFTVKNKLNLNSRQIILKFYPKQ
uniref:Translation initiation factor IF-3, N-terminal domain/Translation initiation factor IF-3, C-terminal domain containing protein, putative n=1 Tax=Theileria annulata TaxID=5874 RepID=A0A3B0MG74_THEAN